MKRRTQFFLCLLSACSAKGSGASSVIDTAALKNSVKVDAPAAPQPATEPRIEWAITPGSEVEYSFEQVTRQMESSGKFSDLPRKGSIHALPERQARFHPEGETASMVNLDVDRGHFVGWFFPIPPADRPYLDGTIKTTWQREGYVTYKGATCVHLSLEYRVPARDTGYGYTAELVGFGTVFYDPALGAPVLSRVAFAEIFSGLSMPAREFHLTMERRLPNSTNSSSAP